MSTLIGYARVSTTDQSTDTQVERLQAAGCTTNRTEKVSGKSRDTRLELATILDFMRTGDTLVVVKLDRLGRDTRDVLNMSMSWSAKERNFACSIRQSRQKGQWARSSSPCSAW